MGPEDKKDAAALWGGWGSAGAWLLHLSFSGTPAAKAVVSPPPRLSSTELWESEKDSQAKVPGLESRQRTMRDPGFGKQV